MKSGSAPFQKKWDTGQFQMKLELERSLMRMNRAPWTRRYHMVQCPKTRELALFRKSMDTGLFHSKSELHRCQMSTNEALWTKH